MEVDVGAIKTVHMVASIGKTVERVWGNLLATRNVFKCNRMLQNQRDIRSAFEFIYSLPRCIYLSLVRKEHKKS